MVGDKNTDALTVGQLIYQLQQYPGSRDEPVLFYDDKDNEYPVVSVQMNETVDDDDKIMDCCRLRSDLFN